MSIPKINSDFSLDEKRFSRDINKDLSIDPDNLDEALATQASLYAYYSLRFQEANELKAQAEFDYERVINELMITVREEMVGSAAKITAAQLDAVVRTRPEALEKKNNFLKISAYRDKLYSIVRSLEHKKDSLISLAYKRRSELESMANSVVYKRREQITGLEE